ncbi:MAG TPA: hydantoinase/oxoprolinase family protein [Planctomycetaceae bacterium]|nr:hydantoinase/oxoprolinase family protein [Planctomycetaceae bacterium]
MHVIGLDIGGANIKAADGEGQASERPFALWKEPAKLSAELAAVLAGFAPADRLAVTMTGELADCFVTKAEGVHFILRSVEAVAAGRPVLVWQTGAEFVTPDVAREIPLLVAAANWHALATWVGRITPRGPAVLIDVGSTTADLVPLLDGVPVPQGLTDCERLRSGELVYSGGRRTPVCAIAHSVPFREGYCPLAAELFATVLDVYLILGLIPEDPHDTNTANGRPATADAAHDRLARALCCDRTEFSLDDALVVARFLADVQQQRLAAAAERVAARLPGAVENVILSGSGEFLARTIVARAPRLRNSKPHVLSELFNRDQAEAACAVAVAVLAQERLAPHI